ncbi:non-ribosomal peptide synthetase-like protein [Allocatelliglobosispora scoriae]|uniref:Non-ribosomal peptide synthetase-like protein n=1 Tax=Allocatelliglobosispora scoriae TaxID=643052 RepID=A0A841BKI1_9ACTN|nr:Pls/PosA family non-ribosomal peptide synthetase [Allocatelliglobosispora scoriae]MBB5868784.1 non-ribosomal peptide synthetase-like protein [Allocatelliglobosispora scoriae]
MELTAVYTAGAAPAERTLIEILAGTTAHHGHAAAIDDGTRVLTYRRLAEEIEARRRQLAAAGIGVGDRVGIRIASGTAELYIAVLAVLSAGAAYVPVDADDPDERAELVFAEAEACAVLGDGGTLTPLTAPHGVVGAPGPDDDAWIIFTSGSTGKPKGVAVTHRSAAAFVDAEALLFLADEPIGTQDRVLAGLSVAFDASCEEMWLAWRHGACLVPAPRSLVRTGVDLGPWLVEQRITIVSTVPTLAGLWPTEALEEVRLLIFGGEACPPELAERMAVEGREVWNTYGPTEATVVACAAQLNPDEPVRIGLPLAGWELAVVDDSGQPVPMGGSGELVIGGVGLARYLDKDRDAEKYPALPALGWGRAYRSGDLVRADPEGLTFLGRGDEQVKLGGRRIELGEVDAALQALPGVIGGASAIQRTRAGNQILVGYVVVGADAAFDHDASVLRLREQLPAALVPLVAVVEGLPTRTSGKIDRAALPWPLTTGPGPAAGVVLTPTQAWLAEEWAEILGVVVEDPAADFFNNGGGSLTAAQLTARIRTRHPQVSVLDVYQNPKLGELAALLDAYEGVRPTRREITATPPAAGIAQSLLTVPLLTVVGLRWTTALAALSTLAAATGLLPWAPSVSWWWLGAAWLVLFSPAGRIAIAAGGARLLLRRVRPGRYPRGGSTHLRLWAAQQLADVSGVASVSGASWTTAYARALGVKVGRDVDLHSAPPITGLLKLGKGAAIEPEVDLAGHWLDGDVLIIGKIRIGAGAHVGARSTLLPGARIGKNADIAAGSVVDGTVPAGQRWSGSPAERLGGPPQAWPTARTERSNRWSLAYGLTSALLGLLPLVAALPGIALIGSAVAGAASPGAAVVAALPAVPLAALTYLIGYAVLVLACVRALGIGLREGYHPVHGRIAWQAWATERLMETARTALYPIYASLFTPVWLRLLGAKVGHDVEASTVLAIPAMTTISDGAFLADDTMIAVYQLNGGWLHLAPASIGKQAFLGNSGMAAPGHAVPNRGLVGVLSAAPRRSKKGSSWLGMPPMPLRRVKQEGDAARTFRPTARLKVIRSLIELCRIVPVMASATLAIGVLATLLTLWQELGLLVAALLSGVVLLAAGLLAALTATAAKWLLVGRFRTRDRPLWSPFVWRNELADTFVEVLAVPWLIGSVLGTPLLAAWLRSMGARIGRGAWSETYWLPESDLVRLGDGVTVNRGCVVQTHLFHDRVMTMDTVRMGDFSTLGPHGIVLPGAEIGERTTIGPGSLVMRGDALPDDTRWLGNPISVWPAQRGRRG